MISPPATLPHAPIEEDGLVEVESFIKKPKYYYYDNVLVSFNMPESFCSLEFKSIFAVCRGFKICLA